MNKKHFLFVYKFLRILGDLIASDKSSSPTFRIDPHLFYGLIFLFADLLCGQGRHLPRRQPLTLLLFLSELKESYVTKTR